LPAELEALLRRMHLPSLHAAAPDVRTRLHRHPGEHQGKRGKGVTDEER
jgi:hypothetical protein